MKPPFRYFFSLVFLLALGIFFLPQGTQKTSADTITRTSPDDECTRHIFLQIEIFTEMDLTDEALEEIADQWADQIDERWNGPTDEEIEQAAEDINQEDTEAGRDPTFEEGDVDVLAGDLSEFPLLAGLRQQLEDRANQNKENANGASNCAIINCCKIFFHTIIETRKPGDDPREGFDQVEVMDPAFRSFVRVAEGGLGANQGGTSGRWAYEPSGSSAAAHEGGHLMGADDFYDDVEGEEGETHSEAHEGHESDLMANSQGWPKGEHITEILRIAGAPCDCCVEEGLTDSYMQGFNLTNLFAMDALAGNNCEHLKTAETSLENQLKDLQAYRATTAAKSDAANQLQSRLDEIREALEDCDKPRPVTGTDPTETAIGIGQDGIPTAPFSYDSLECTTYGGGTVDLPTIEFDPTPETPGQTPGSTPETPGTTPGSTPETPGTTPEDKPIIVTPGAAIDPAGREIIIPEEEPIDFGTITGEVIVPFGPEEYDDGSTWFPEEDDGIIITPYDQTTTTTETPEDEEEPPEDQVTSESWYIFKVEQDVLQNDGTIEIGPAEKTVLKLGYPAPDKPGSGTVRTAEDTNNGSSAEPRFVETDDDGIGRIPIFVDGFESGDTSSWSDYGRPEGSENKNTNAGTYHVTGFTLDATPRKSRIVYLKAEEANLLGSDIGAVSSDNTKPPAVDIQSPGSGTTGTPVPIRPVLTDQESDPTNIEPGFSTDDGTPFTPTPAQGGEKPNGKEDLVPTPAQGGENPEDDEENDPPTEQTELPDSVKPYVTDSVQFGTTLGVTLSYKYHLEDDILVELEDFQNEDNRYLKEKMDDPYYESSGTWGQPYDDQWAIKSVGFIEGENGAWAAAGDDLAPVIVAFIDSGIDWNHADISWDNIWINPGEIDGNGIDDDMNGYIDDTIGWDFYTNNASPLDQDGHGTFTAGMVIATKNNGVGIAGINPAAKIMVLKALNDFGHTRASYVAKAIKYATDNGARVINLSIGGENQTYLEQLAIKYAHDRGVVIVVAAGNEAMEISEYGFAPYPEVIAVASSDFEGKRVFFSNIGPEIDIAAPGLDVLSLRARMTDFMRHLKDVSYVAGSAYVGDDKRYFRSSGTSFSAPIVTGIASLILSMNPELTNVEVKRMILNSARDVEIPGTDQFTGYGVVDAVAALNADPAFEIIAYISSVAAVQDETGAFFVNVEGTADANAFAGASVQIGIGEAPSSWKEVATVDNRVTKGALAKIDANEFRAAPTWTIRVVVSHANGRTREQWYVLQLG